jgi:UDP-N-acetylglucosamine acyltransferase
VIHPSAIIHPKAKLHASAKVGPYAVIDEGVTIGAGCVIGPHVYLTGQTIIGERNQVFAGCVIGEAPQDLKYKGAPTGVKIGNGNVFREHVTVHRSSELGAETVIGSDNFLMANSHVAHNCQIGNRCIFANGVLLGGHVIVDDAAFLSGNAVVHQHVRVGKLAMLQGGSALSMDLPPYTIGHDLNVLCGLNVVGLRRAGVSAAERLELKQVYRALFREGINLRPAVEAARNKFRSGPAQEMLGFVATSKRGICFDNGKKSQSETD